MSQLDLEEVKERIKKETDLGEEEIEEQIEEKKEKYGGLLNNEGAAFSVAKENGVEVESGHEPEPTKIDDLNPQLQKVMVKGTVKKIFPVRKWEKEDREGKVGNIVIKDDTGEVRVVLWNKKCKMIEENELEVGDKVEIKNCDLRENNGTTELSGGEIKKIEDEELPELDMDYTEISDLSPGEEEVNTYARVVRSFPVNTFKKEDREGKVANAIIFDGEETRLVLWNQNAEKSKDVSPGDKVKIEGGYAKENDGETEIHVGWRGRLIKDPEEAPELPEMPEKKTKRKKISELEEGDSYTSVLAVIVDTYEPKVVNLCPDCRKKGEEECPECGKKTAPTLIQNLVLDDGTEVVRAVAFREKAEKIDGFKPEEYNENKDVFDKKKILGEEKVFSGQVKLNKINKEKEFIIHEIKKPNLKQEMKQCQTK